MWRAFYTCPLEDPRCYPVERMRERHPVTDTEPKPRCNDHGKEMRLAKWEQVEEKERKKPRPPFRKGGFKSQQMDLF